MLAGGFLTDAWLGQPPPRPPALANRSLVKYHLIIEEWGGWGKFQVRAWVVIWSICVYVLFVLCVVVGRSGLKKGNGWFTFTPPPPQTPTQQKQQGLLRACRRVADRHQAKQERGVTVAMVAIAYVLALPGVAAVILGTFVYVCVWGTWVPDQEAPASTHTYIYSHKHDHTNTKTTTTTIYTQARAPRTTRATPCGPPPPSTSRRTTCRNWRRRGRGTGASQGMSMSWSGAWEAGITGWVW